MFYAKPSDDRDAGNDPRVLAALGLAMAATAFGNWMQGDAAPMVATYAILAVGLGLALWQVKHPSLMGGKLRLAGDVLAVVASIIGIAYIGSALLG